MSRKTENYNGAIILQTLAPDPASNPQLTNCQSRKLRLFHGVQFMTTKERDEMNQICKLIQEEKDPQKFTQLVMQLDQLLTKKEDSLIEQQERAKA